MGDAQVGDQQQHQDELMQLHTLSLCVGYMLPFRFRYYFSKFDCCVSLAGSRLL